LIDWLKGRIAMSKFIVWADGRKEEAVIIEASNLSSAIEQATGIFGVDEERVNVIGESINGGDNVAASEYYGVTVESDISSWLDGTDGCTFCEYDPAVCNDGGVCQRGRVYSPHD
jgi:hypothetical protein